MNRPGRRWTGLTLAVLALCLSGSACGGGGGSFSGNPVGNGPGGLQATFTPSNATPGAMTLSMAPGASNAASFDVGINVTGINAFFGAAFRVPFDPTRARFDGFSSDGSFIKATGVTTDFRAAPDSSAPGTLLINATRQGQFAGVNAVGSQLLITLQFTALTSTASSPFTFGTAATRQVTTCPAPPGACSNIADANLTWSGGTLTAN